MNSSGTAERNVYTKIEIESAASIIYSKTKIKKKIAKSRVLLKIIFKKSSFKQFRNSLKSKLMLTKN